LDDLADYSTHALPWLRKIKEFIMRPRYSKIIGALSVSLKQSILAIFALIWCCFVPLVWAASVESAMEGLKKLEPIPDRIANVYDRIDKTKQYSEGDSKFIDHELGRYANDMRRSYTLIVKLTQSEAKSEGKSDQGATKALVALEKLAQEHEKKFSSLEARGKKLEAAIKSGDILLDEASLKGMRESQREDFLKYVSEPAGNTYRAKYKELFAAAVERFANLISTPAEASQLIGCVSICPQAAAMGAWPACLACVIAAGASSASRWSTYRNAMAACNRLPWSWMKTPCKIAATTAYLSYIA
jgi:hypothetical protein